MPSGSPLATVDVLRALLRGALARPGSGRPGALDELRERGASRATWEDCLLRMEQNRFLAPMGGVVVRHGLLETVPSGPRERLAGAYGVQLDRNRRRMAMFGEVLAGLRELEIEPVLLKSSALVALLYASQAGNQMSDVDVWVPSDRLDDCTGLLVSRGFVEQGREADASDYLDATGTLRIDLHHRFRLFERFAVRELFTDVPATCPGLDRVRVFEPNAMLAHLVFHMNGHRPTLGYQLRWLLDIGFVLEEWAGDFRVPELRRLLGSEQRVGQVLRVVRFFVADLGVAMPRQLLSAAAGMEGFTLDEVLRSQRTDPWPIWRPQGWMRMASCLLGVSKIGDRIYPKAHDLLAAVRDRAREARDVTMIESSSPLQRRAPALAPAARGAEGAAM